MIQAAPDEKSIVYRNIVVAYDGSEGAEQALRKAAPLAAASGGTLHLVESVGKLKNALQGVVSGTEEELPGAQRSLERAAGGLRETRGATRVVKGDPVKGIIGAAADLDADLIVMGSRGRAYMPQAVLGRVTSGVVSNAPCDVLVVEPRP